MEIGILLFGSLILPLTLAVGLYIWVIKTRKDKARRDEKHGKLVSELETIILQEREVSTTLEKIIVEKDETIKILKS